MAQGRQRLTVVLIASAVAHAPVLYLKLAPPNPAPATTLAVELVAERAPASATAAPIDGQATASPDEALSDSVPPAANVADTADPPTVAEAREAPAPARTPDDEPADRQPLDLTPPDYSTLDRDLDESALARFNHELATALAERRKAQRRAALLAGRREALTGLSVERYNEVEGNRGPGGHIKTAVGCFELKHDPVALNGSSYRFWMVTCKDLVRSAFDLPVLTFGPDGRAVVDE